MTDPDTNAALIRRFYAPTGRKVRLASTIICRFEQGRVAEEREIFDKFGMCQQPDVTPPPACTEAAERP